MRRQSDHAHGPRTGEGRRARDKNLTGELMTGRRLQVNTHLKNLTLFLSDDLRESALALSGIEALLNHARNTLERPDLCAEDLRAIVDDRNNVERLELLWDALSSLLKSMSSMHDCLQDAATDRA